MSKNNNSIQNDINKPTPFIAPFSNTPLTEADLDRRERKNHRLREIGVNPTKIDGDDSENPDLVQAMIYINKDEEVPPELLGKIKQPK